MHTSLRSKTALALIAGSLALLAGCGEQEPARDTAAEQAPPAQPPQSAAEPEAAPPAGEQAALEAETSAEQSAAQAEQEAVTMAQAETGGAAAGGPASGFRTEPGSSQTHNVVQTLPSDAGYSPLWSVSVYDNADFDRVDDLASVLRANILARGVALVNCPIVVVDDGR